MPADDDRLIAEFKKWVIAAIVILTLLLAIVFPLYKAFIGSMGLIGLAFAIYAISQAIKASKIPTRSLNQDRFVLRKTSTGLEIIRPGEAYERKKEDTVILIKPEQQLFETAAGPRILRWQADLNRLQNYVEFYRPLRSESRALVVAGIKDFFKVNPRPTIEFLQNRHADHFGVKILTLDLPPEAPRVAAPVPPPQDRRSKAEKDLDRLFAGVKTAAQARQRWEREKKNPDFAAALADPQVGPKLSGKYEDLINAIAEGEV
jgi:hypothetical protein